MSLLGNTVPSLVIETPRLCILPETQVKTEKEDILNPQGTVLTTPYPEEAFHSLYFY
jgi:hypothetical protein